ncbi:hybrid sensor histidine kinase/response regulator transcription factor [Bacteroides congonensis]|uniref:hybrid sensor histidine kinase/response regulator transcription factor n=1 Tax=Bacteroides congonensis TaxID=1871006 RepID=UPI0018A0F44B|nr:hybrid sensor histidine kinase/response regulator transcription factor [Bacteroides congonensis]
MKRFLIFCLLAITLLLPVFPIPSQSEKQVNSHSFTYQYLTTKEGLSNQRVFSILEDKKGFIWISTRSGVDCFNGRTVKNYNLFGEDIIVDGAGRMIYLTKDLHETLWAYTSAGKVFKYDPISDAFTLEIDVAELTESGILLNDLFIDSSDRFWFGLKNGLFRYAHSSGNIENILKGKCINSIHFSPANEVLYIATTEGLYERNPQNGEITSTLPVFYVQSVFYDSATSLLWIGTFNSGIKVRDTRTENYLSNEALNQLPHLPYRSVIIYDEQTLLLGIDGAGVCAVTRDAKTSWSFLNANQEEEGELKGNGIYALCKDSSSNLWIGSYTGGVACANPKRYFFELTRHEYKNPQSLTNNHVNAILEDNEGDLWYATNQGISVHLTKSGNWKHFLKENVFLTLCNDGDGNVWTGGYGTGVYCLNKHTGIRRHLTTDQSGTLTTNYIYSILKDENNKDLWLGGMYGNLVRYTPSQAGKAEEFTSYDITLINSITQVNKDTLALATANGLYLLDKQTGNFRQYFTSPSNADTRSNSFIYSMYFPAPDKVWFGTDGGGINLLDLKTGKAVTYSTADGLPSNYVYSILPDNKGHLWLSTDKGLAYITPSPTPEITNIGFLDGLANEFNFMSYTRLRNGDFVYGSTNGAVRFNPENFTRPLYEAPLHFTSFEVPQKSREKTEEKKIQFNRMLNEGKTIRLKYNENSFLISFISVSYQYQQDIQYSYQLKGFEQNWSAPTKELGIRYTNIPPGDYTFHVKSMSKNGGRQLDEQTIRIHIAQPYWNTTLAWLIYIILLAGITYFVWRFFANKMEKKHFSEKIQFFINTAHDIRTPVTLIMAPLGDLSKEEGLSKEGKRYLQIARKNTEKLYNLIAQLLDFQKIDTTHLTLQVAEYDLKSYLQEKVLSFQTLCESKQIRMQLLLPDSPVSLWMDKDKTDKIFDNLFSNAVKYTPAGGEITVKVEQNDKKITIAVKDNGIGIPRKAQRYIFSNFYRAENAVNSKETGSGIGLLLTRRLMKLHKGHISFSSNEGEGSTFLLTFRKGNRHLAKYIVPARIDTSIISATEPVTEVIEPSDLLSDVPDLSDTDLSDTDTNNAPQTDKSKERIMIVEDNDELRFYLKKTFAPIYSVIDKPDGESALEYLKDKSVELIISDVMMPGIQGDELCRRIKSDFATSHIPVILLTAKTEKDAILEGLESGADDYLTKPFDTEILKTKIKGVLQNRKIMREYFLSHSLSPVPAAATPNEEKENAECAASLLSPMDKEFLERCTRLVTENLANPDFTINQLCREVALSRTLFYEKLKALTGQAPTEFIKLLRMTEAANLLKQQIPVQEVALLVGFTDAKYFSTAFKKHYGVSPSKFL